MKHEALRLLRVFKDLNIQELTDKIGYRSRSYISELEGGKRKIPPKIIKKYHEHFNLDHDFIFDLQECLEYNENGFKAKLSKALENTVEDYKRTMARHQTILEKPQISTYRFSQVRPVLSRIRGESYENVSER